MATAKEIKGRIQSIKNTQKTTKAMELVSGAKMRKAVGATLKSRPYQAASWSIMSRLRQTMTDDTSSPVLRFFTPAAAQGHTTIIFLTSNRGLCGAFNSNIVKLVSKKTNEVGKDRTRLIGIGKRGVASITSFGYNVEQAYEKNDTAANDDSIREVAAFIHQSFLKGETDQVFIAYTHYISPLVQEARLTPLFPFPETSLTGDEETTTTVQYTHEPSQEEVLTTIIPRAAEVELYQALLESNASEHSARMVAMKNATEAAGEMKQELVLAFNRARQAAITKEIAEIAAGSAALGV